MYTVGRKLAYGQSDAAVEIVKGHPYIAVAKNFVIEGVACQPPSS